MLPHEGNGIPPPCRPGRSRLGPETHPRCFDIGGPERRRWGRRGIPSRGGRPARGRFGAPVAPQRSSLTVLLEGLCLVDAFGSIEVSEPGFDAPRRYEDGDRLVG